jgi:hypothetical protein
MWKSIPPAKLEVLTGWHTPAAHSDGVVHGLAFRREVFPCERTQSRHRRSFHKQVQEGDPAWRGNAGPRASVHGPEASGLPEHLLLPLHVSQSMHAMHHRRGGPAPVVWGSRAWQRRSYACMGRLMTSRLRYGQSSDQASSPEPLQPVESATRAAVADKPAGRVRQSPPRSVRPIRPSVCPRRLCTSSA